MSPEIALSSAGREPFGPDGKQPPLAQRPHEVALSLLVRYQTKWTPIQLQGRSWSFLCVGSPRRQADSQTSIALPAASSNQILHRLGVAG